MNHQISQHQQQYPVIRKKGAMELLIIGIQEHYTPCHHVLCYVFQSLNSIRKYEEKNITKWEPINRASALAFLPSTRPCTFPKESTHLEIKIKHETRIPETLFGCKER